MSRFCGPFLYNHPEIRTWFRCNVDPGNSMTGVMFVFNLDVTYMSNVIQPPFNGTVPSLIERDICAF